MGENSQIQWTHHSWSPWIGCTKISAGCTNCYADEMMTRKPRWANTWGPRGKRVRTSESYWKRPLKWNREAEEAGVHYRVFPSLCDPFDEHESIRATWMIDWFRIIRDTPRLDWLLLTKRPENAKRMLPPHWWSNWPANVWIGTSVEDQETADKRIPALLEVPARIRFLSCEPLLGPIDLTLALGGEDGTGWGGYGFRPAIDWVIIGGESGSNARPMDIAWAEDIIDQCKSAGAATFMKQMGSNLVQKSGILPGHVTIPLKHKKGGNIEEWPERFRIREFPELEETPGVLNG